MNFTALLGHIQPLSDRYTQRQRIVRCALPKNKAEYARIASERWEKKTKSTLGLQASRLHRRATQLGRGGTQRQRRKLKAAMDKYMKALTNELMAIEAEMVNNPMGKKKRGKGTRNCWSVRMAQQQNMHNKLLGVLRHCYRPTRRPEVKTNMKMLLAECRSEHTELFMRIANPPPTTAKNKHWVQYASKTRAVLRELNQSMHLRARRKWQCMMKGFKHDREEQRKHSQTLKKYLDYALQRPSNEAKPWCLMKPTGAGDMKVIDKPDELKKEEVRFTEEHMGKGRKRWYIQTNGKVIGAFSQTPVGRRWRKKLQEGSMTTTDWKCIPKELRYIFREARAVKNDKGERMSGEMYGNIFTTAISVEQMDAHIAQMKKNTAPGRSGIRIDHIAALPQNMKQLVATAISIPYLTGMGYDMWNEEIVNWIPKEAGNMDINKRRPIMYYEVLRKLHVAVKLKEVLNVWRTNGVLDDDNYAFLTGRTTVQPLMIKKMILEDAKFFNKDLTMVDVDFSKAYDSTEKFAKEISLRRLGFPQEGLDLWQQYDNTRKMAVLTAHGLTDTFTPECGAWGQGAPEAPIGWLALMCWMCAAVEKKAEHP